MNIPVIKTSKVDDFAKCIVNQGASFFDDKETGENFKSWYFKEYGVNAPKELLFWEK